MEQNKSEVARAMERIDLEMEAISHLKHGYTMTSRHDFINARAQRGAERILGLIDRGQHEKAQVLMNTENWGEPEPEEQQDEQAASHSATQGQATEGTGIPEENKGKATNEASRRA